MQGQGGNLAPFNLTQSTKERVRKMTTENSNEHVIYSRKDEWEKTLKTSADVYGDKTYKFSMGMMLVKTKVTGKKVTIAICDMTIANPECEEWLAVSLRTVVPSDLKMHQAQIWANNLFEKYMEMLEDTAALIGAKTFGLEELGKWEAYNELFLEHQGILYEHLIRSPENWVR